MFSELWGSVGCCGFDLLWGQNEYCEMCIYMFISNHAAFRRPTQDWLARVRIIDVRLSIATIIHAECDCSELTLLKIQQCVGLVQNHQYLLNQKLVGFLRNGKVITWWLATIVLSILRSDVKYSIVFESTPGENNASASSLKNIVWITVDIVFIYGYGP